MTSLLPPSDLQVNAMRAAILARTTQVRRRRRRTKVLALLTAVVVLATGVTACVFYVLASIDARNTSFECYTTTSLHGPHVMTLMGDDDRQKERLLSTEERVAKAIEVCTAVYPTFATQPVPNPTACLLKDGRIGVLPNQDNRDVRSFCLGIGLRPPQN